MRARRVLFSGYARVHFVCFLPVYERLRADPRLEVYLSGGYKSEDGEGNPKFSISGFYDEFDVDRTRVLEAEATRSQDFDVMVCAHLSDTLFPRSAARSVQIFHGVSFKNLAVRDKALRYDYLCLPGSYHAEQYRKQGLVRDDGPSILITGFPKADKLVAATADTRAPIRELDLDPSLPTLLFAPTGDKHNALEIMGREVIERIRNHGRWNLLVKPHDHPKRSIDWFRELADLENERVRLVRATDVAPYLRAADLLMTDASSVALEYTLLDRPMVFLDTPQLLEKLRERAPALDLETYGRKLGRVARGPDDLLPLLEASLADPGRDAAVRRQAAAHLFHLPGQAAERVAAVIRHAAGLEAVLPRDVERVRSE